MNRTRTRLAAVGIVTAVVTVASSKGQEFPGKPHIYNAAQRLNSIAPQAVAQQSILIGAFDGGTNRFQFLLEPSYPPTSRPSQREEEGGHIKPRYVADINSYNVQYVFNIVNKPPGFGITIELPQPDGSVLKKDATITAGGTRAVLSFNPKSFRQQVVTIHRPGLDTVVRITPQLRPQLGSFVVPYMLTTIIYEPPGSGSSSTFAQTSTANTVISWGFARTSGLVETTAPSAMFDLFGQALGLAAGAVLGDAGDDAMKAALKAATVGDMAAAKGSYEKGSTAAGAVPWLAALQVIADLREETTVTKTTTDETRTTRTQGTSISITASYTTNQHQYPGRGDLFVVLHDVLFTYLALKGKVYLAPMAYAGADYYTAARMRQELPADIAERFIALNPHLSQPPLYPMSVASAGSSSKAGGRVTPTAADWGGIGSIAFSSRFMPYGPAESIKCKDIGSPGLTFSRTDFESTQVAHTHSEMVLEHVTGLMATIKGGGDKLAGTTYSTAMEQGTAQTQSTAIELACAPDDQFWVNVYLDKIFRTFLTLRGAPLSTTAALAGTAQRPDGRPMAGQIVKLLLGGHTYVVRSDESGNFDFPVARLPAGAGEIRIGGAAYRISYDGQPKRLLLKGSAVVTQAPASQAPVQPSAPEQRLPVAVPGARPGRP